MSILSVIALLFKISGILALILISLLVFFLVIVPQLKMRHYKKQGLSCYFFPLLGINKRDKLYEQKTGDILGYYKELPKTDPNLPAVVGNAGPRVDLLLFDPKLLKEFFQNPSNYHKSHASKVVKALMGTGLFLAEGDQWKKNRKTIASTFHFDFLKQCIPLTVKTTREFLNKLAETSMENVNVMDEVQKITGEMVGRIFFSENLNSYNLKGQPLTLYLASLLGRLGLLFRNPKVFACLVTGFSPEKVAAYREFVGEINEFRQFCLKIVQDRKAASTATNDLLQMLLETQKTGNAEDQFSDEDIVNEFITFFVAGMDTTGHLITMILYMLHQHPGCLEKIEKEVNETYAREDIASYDALNKMEFTHSVIKETLRMYNPAPVYVPRIAQVDHTLGNIQIKKGMSVRAIPLYNSFNPKYFEEPGQFKPERWTNNNNKENEMDPFVFIPFSTGPRNCIGQHLAIIETKIIVAEFVKMFRFKVSQEDYKLRMSFSSLYEPKEKIMMNLQRK